MNSISSPLCVYIKIIKALKKRPLDAKRLPALDNPFCLIVSCCYYEEKVYGISQNTLEVNLSPPIAVDAA
jgi:hypothetical protein